MTAVVRGWLGFCALGAGLIHLALVIGSPPAVGIPLLVDRRRGVRLGGVRLHRAGAAAAADRAGRRRSSRSSAGWSLLVVTGGSGAIEGLRVLPMLVASLLDLGDRDRHHRDTAARPGATRGPAAAGPLSCWPSERARSSSPPSPLPALAATEAGFAAIPHEPGDEPFELILPGLHGSH